MEDLQGFSHNQRARNAISLRLAAILTVVFFPTFWVLDWFVVPQHLALTGSLRALCGLFGLFLFWASYRRRRWLMRHVYGFTLLLPLLIIWSICVMCWVHEGYESSYYAGINTVLLVVGMIFSWDRKIAVVFHLSAYGFYMAPLVLGFLHIHNAGEALCSQFFMITTMLLTSISQQHRVAMEKRQFRQRRTLKGFLSEMRRFATTDSLTGIFNRRHQLTVGEREFRRCERYKRSFAVILIDIDFFKKINDTYTHRVGDEVIHAMAFLLSRSIRSIDIIGRYGGEEFLILLPEADTQQAIDVVANRIQEALKREPVYTSAGPLKVTLSMGVSGKRQEVSELSNLIHRADVALYEAKRGGRDRVVEWTPQMETAEPKAA